MANEMGKKGRKVTECYAEILSRLDRMEDKLDKRMESQSERIRSLESFRAFTRGSVAVCLTALGLIGSYITGIFK